MSDDILSQMSARWPTFNWTIRGVPRRPVYIGDGPNSVRLHVWHDECDSNRWNAIVQVWGPTSVVHVGDGAGFTEIREDWQAALLCAYQDLRRRSEPLQNALETLETEIFGVVT